MLRQHLQLRVDLGRHGSNARQGVWGEGHARMLAGDEGQQGRLGISTTAVSWAAGLARASVWVLVRSMVPQAGIIWVHH